jgi:hypothetical protein
MSQSSFSLSEISKWAEPGSKFDLPNVQRGFVWKPYQIEDLWDSILRKYPIGCFVLSKSSKAGVDGYGILDGQQRATSIALGFESNTFKKETRQNYKLFIDLDYTKTEKVNKEFLFRIITKSHPWGYEKKDNSKTLDISKIRKALETYGLDTHLDKSLDKYFFPFDANLPIPFSLLIYADTPEEAIENVRKWPLLKKVKSHFQHHNESVTDFDTHLSNSVEKMFRLVKLRLSKYPNIPALYLDVDDILKNSNPEEKDNAVKNDGETVGDNKVSDEIENLFVRLNSSGTPLRGEELNYSILKAHIDKNLQKKIEQACELFIRPARFISILFRIYTNDTENIQSGNISLRIKAKDFQKIISEKKDGFQKYIEKLLEDRIYNGKTLIEYAKSLLEFQPTINEFGFPYIVYSRIAENAPEIMFSLLFRLKVKKDRFDFNTDLHKRMLGVVSLLYWLGKGENGRDYSKLLRNIWPSLSEINEAENFWSNATISRAQINDVMCYFPKFTGKNGLKELLKSKSNETRREPFEFEDTYIGFRNSTLYNRELVAYAQREFLHQQFKPIHYGLEDTNVPFDWDHISPQHAISIRPVARPIKSAYKTIGNFRAWPYSLNRENQADTPSTKFDPLSLISDDRIEKNKELQAFSTRLNKEIKNSNKLTSELLGASFCERGWLYCSAEKLRTPKEWKPVYQMILERNIDLYEEWYKSLKINELYPLKSAFNFPGLFYSGKWFKNVRSNSDKILRDYLDYKENEYWYSRTNNKNFILYFGFNHSKTLEQDSFFFGIIDTDKNGKLSTVKISDELASIYQSDKRSEDLTDVYGTFTLISTEVHSYWLLLGKIYTWINHFPDKELKQLMLEYISSGLKKENKRYFTTSKKSN